MLRELEKEQWHPCGHYGDGTCSWHSRVPESREGVTLEGEVACQRDVPCVFGDHQGVCSAALWDINMRQVTHLPGKRDPHLTEEGQRLKFFPETVREAEHFRTAGGHRL